ncbi:MAG: DUF3685 domain-containing protein [Leptolyngbyaceae cyanobacterium bins.302]|nr:DUF3685 domain-containing protein [Leptolyngbyaceae cyanobacterium bins.302]
MLIDSDPQFRQGFATCLAQDADLQVVLEADSTQGALQVLQQWFSQQSDFENRDIENNKISLNLILLSLELPPLGPGAISLCQELRRQYPELPILTMSDTATPALLAAAFQAGAMGYCHKTTVTVDWIAAIRQVAAGYPFWVQGMGAMTQTIPSHPVPSQPTLSQPTPSSLQPVSRPGLAAKLRQNLRQTGLDQIDTAIAEIDEQLKAPSLTFLDYLFLTGRRRELSASRWLIDRLLTPQPTEPATRTPQGISQNTRSSPPPPFPISNLQSPTSTASSLSPQPETTAIRGIQATLFDTTFAKLQFGLRNLTDTPLEIDILRDDRKRELLETVLRQLEEVLAELKFSQVDRAQLTDKQAVILMDLWRATTIEFFGRYATLSLGDSPTDPLNQVAVEMVDVLLQDGAIVQADILSKIPLVSEFLGHLLFQVPLMVDETGYAVGTVEAMHRMEALLQNLMIQVGNAVMQPLLNRFGNVVAVKQSYYDRRLLSTREIERFRNNLSWKYRMQRYFKEPTAIFESRYCLLILGELGIVQASIYAPRSQELDELAGVGLAVTLALEARDAIAPRLRSAISFVGSGVVYVLTEVIGRGIGLIGRGIIKGVGNVVQDPKFNRNGNPGRGMGSRE